MKKFTIVLLILITMPIMVKAQKNEIAGKISALQILPDSQKYIVINNTQFNINSGTKVRTKLKENVRVVVFYETDANDSLKIAKTIVAENLFVPMLRFVIPIPSSIPNTAISTIRSIAPYEEEYGNVSSWGFGVWAEMRAYRSLRLFFDANSYKYKQEIVKEGDDVHHYIGTGGIITFPSGAKYSTNTVALRLGLKYVFLRDKNIQPWVGAGYGLNVWKVQYMTWDEEHIYGKANGVTGRSSILAGIEFKLENVATFSFFFEAISPAAEYTMENLFGIGDYHQLGGMTFPTPRLGFSIGGL